MSWPAPAALCRAPSVPSIPSSTSCSPVCPPPSSVSALTAIGYVSAQPQPGDPCTAPVYWMAMFLWMGLPILGWICTLIAMHWYPLTKEKMEEVEQTNARIRAERAAAKSE